LLSFYLAFYTPWTSILAWSLLASEHFFSTGHQAVITSIQWQSAFHGFHGDFDHYVIPAGLILSNTFASHIIIIVSLPLLLFWPRVRRGIIHIFEKPVKGVEDTTDSRGEFALHEHSDRLWSGLFQLFVGFIIIQGLKVSTRDYSVFPSKITQECY
jgi:phosphatidylinositol glycan class O